MKMARGISSLRGLGLFLVAVVVSVGGATADNNRAYRPCQDTTIQRNDGFTFGLVSAQNSSFFNKNIQLSPCDKRLTGLSSGQSAIFRPKVDEISLLVINISQFNPEYYGGYGVVYAGSRHAAVSKPVFLANGNYHVNSLSLVLEFDKGRLVNMLWKNDKCASCAGMNTTFVCLDGQLCAIRSQFCNGDPKTKVDCSLTIQTTFSGTDKYQEPLTSWYQLKKIRQYSLYSLYGRLGALVHPDSIVGQHVLGSIPLSGTHRESMGPSAKAAPTSLSSLYIIMIFYITMKSVVT